MKFIKEIQANLAKKASPKKIIESITIKSNEFEFKTPNSFQFDISTIKTPTLTEIPRIREPLILEYGVKFNQTIEINSNNLAFQDALENYLLYERENLMNPEIKVFSLKFNIPKIAGKTYLECSYQSDFEILNREPVIKKGPLRSHSQVAENIFIEKSSLLQLILPILQPPLGERFDNPIVFKSGQKLYPFQIEGVKFLANQFKAILGDEMGLGKSIQAIVAMRLLFRAAKISTCLIICPKSVITDWHRKLEEWAPELRVMKIQGLPGERKIHWQMPSHVYLVNYDTLRQDEDISKKDFDLVILDEIQKIKNPISGITKAVRKINHKFCWGLSGTPLENRLEELVSIFSYVKPGLLKYSDIQNPERVKESIKPYFLRRRKRDVLKNLPKKVQEEVWLELTPAQRKAYDKAEKEGVYHLKEIGKTVTIQHIWALISRLKQICNYDPSSNQSCKLEYLIEKLKEIVSQGDKAIIFSQYPNRTLKFLEPALKKFNPLVYDGSLSQTQRDYVLRKFQEDDENKIILMSVKSGSLGITLTRANYVFHFDLWWNPSTALQAEDRAHRIGQKKTVFVSSLFTVNTIEERIQKLLSKKRQLFKEVIDDLSDARLSEILTEEDLLSLFNLKKTKRKTK